MLHDEFMRQFKLGLRRTPLRNLLGAQFIQVDQLIGMDFIMVAYEKDFSNCGKYHYIVFREIYNGEVLEPCYTMINDARYRGVLGWDKNSTWNAIGMHCRFERLFSQMTGETTDIAIQGLEDYDPQSDTIIDYTKR